MLSKYVKSAAILAVVGLSTFGAVACASPEPFTIQAPGLFPEGLEYDRKRGAFLITSLTTGKVHAVKPDGSRKLLIDDPDLVSAIGIRVDRNRNRLYVCSSDPGVSSKTAPATRRKLAGLGVYRLSDGKKESFLRLDALNPGTHFCNDIALAKNGELYITNSFSTVIYRVDRNLKPTVLVNDPRFRAKGFGLNGILAMGDFLLVAHSESGKLYRVGARDGSVQEVGLDKAMKFADGLVALGPDKVAIALNGSNEIAYYETKDGWKTARRTRTFDRGFSFPTTGVLVKGRLFYLNGKLHKLFGGKRDIAEFEVRELPLN